MSLIDALKATLSHPLVYDAFNICIGEKRSADMFIHQYVKPQPGARVLDVGCGYGRLARYFRDCTYTGIDISQPYIEEAKKLHPWAQFVCTDACTHPLPPSSATIAIMGGVMHHLSDEQCRKLLKNLASALAPDGVLTLSEPAYVEKQSAVVRWLLDHDRGEYVRWNDAYKELLSVDFTILENAVRHDMLRIPYTHTIFRVTPLKKA